MGERAARATVRELEAAVRQARGRVDDDDEEWVALRTQLPPDERAVVDAALALAGELMPGASRMERLEAIAQETLGEVPGDPDTDDTMPLDPAFRRVGPREPSRRAVLEAETERWSVLAAVVEIEAPDVEFPETASAAEVDATLRELARLRSGWDRIIGYCAHAVRTSGMHRILGFASFRQYVEERLGLSARAVEQRADVEERLWASAALRAARDQGLSFEKLRLLAKLSDVDVEIWTPRAMQLTCVALERALDDRRERQMRARGELVASVPRRIAVVLAAAIRVVSSPRANASPSCQVPRPRACYRRSMPFGPLVAPESLAALGELRLLDARPGADAYAAGHLAGALHADLNVQLSAASEPGFDPARGGRHPLPDAAGFAAQLGAWGIGPGTRVVVYDAAGGGNAAARAWWMLRALGHADVAVLDGGLPAAQAAGLALTKDVPAIAPLPPYPRAAWTLPVIELEGVADRLADRAWKVLDVRSAERWRGETEPLDPIPGRIPGTVNLPFAENLGAGGRFKPPAALRSLYLGLLGGTPPERLVVHCGSGVTACHTLLALELAGLPGAALYVGSYGEWCRSGRPLGRGA